jgi:hypothetical protein
MTTENKSISEEKLTAFMTKAAADFGATWSGVLVNIGDKLGLYKEMSRSGPISSEEPANRTGPTFLIGANRTRIWFTSRRGQIE